MKKDRKKRLRRLSRRSAERREQRGRGLVEGTGVIRLSSHGYGFVKLSGGEGVSHVGEGEEIFIPARYIGDALDGDTVRVKFAPEKVDDPERGPVGNVVEVVERKRAGLVGEVIPGHRLRPMSRRVPGDVQLVGSLRGAQNGDWVEIKLLPPSEKSRGERLGMVVEKIGQAGLIAADLDAVCAEYELPPAYSEEENEQASGLEPREIGRRDLRKMHTVTIDPEDAKDFDDAVGVMAGENPDELVIGVHISDVASYIAPGGEFDRQAALRGFTAYLPGRTLPMLPKALTAKISLREGVDSLAHTVLFTVNASTGQVLKVERCHSVIHVDRRLNYKEVQRFFDKGESNWGKEVEATVSQELKIAQLWRRERKQREKFLELAMPEIRVLCDEANNKIIGLASKVQRESEQLIEEYMLAANSAVAAELTQRKLPGLFRVHPAPEPEKLDEFMGLAAETFNLKVGDLTNRDECNKFIASLPDNELRPIILNAFLRSLPRASYQAEPALHFGLGKTLYSHFTSPIRRYTDLLVHQQLWSFDVNEKWKSQNKLSELAATCSEQEENNDNAYYAANDRLKLRYLDEQLGKGRSMSYTGIVRKVTSAGLLVDISELGIYGFVPLSSLGSGFRRRNGVLSSRHYRTAYQMGDLVHLELSRVDFSKGSAIFDLLR